MDVKKALLIDKTENKIVAQYEQKEYYELAISGDIKHAVGWNSDGTPNEVEFFANVHIKWDGCSHFFFKGEDERNEGYYHICGIYGYVEHMAMMMFAYEIMVAHVGEDKIDEIEELEVFRKLNVLNDYAIIFN